MAKKPNKITITKTDDEFRVPGPGKTESSAYYTDDREDAIGTARAMWGKDVQFSFRTKR